MIDTLQTLIKKNSFIILFSFFCLCFSSWLMFTTFSYSSGSMLIAEKAWSDFGNHIPLIRSFSLGNNFPPQYPLFPGLPIRYHFLFYAFVGILEKLGLRIDYALNIPSIFGFAGLLMGIYLFAKKIFKSSAVGVLSVLFFLFNGTFSFLQFFKDHPLSSSTIRQIVSNADFPSFAPYGKGPVSAFWNLNIYTNQRHLAASYATSLVLIVLMLGIRKTNIRLGIVLGIVLACFFFFNMAVFAMTILLYCMIFLFFQKTRITTAIALLTAGILSFPQFILVHPHAAQTFSYFRPGYLITENLAFQNIFLYWLFNLGLHTIFIPIGFILADTRAKKIFLCFLSLFIIGNLFQFSVEIAANHKFFNYFMLIGVMFSAYAVTTLFKRYDFLKPVSILVVFFLVLSGVIDFFPVYNDSKVTLLDYPKDPDIVWIKNNTSKSSIFLNGEYMYDKASLAGRAIFLGWPYFAWSQGYDTTARDTIRKSLFSSANKQASCMLIKQNNLGFISFQRNKPYEDLIINYDFFEHNFQKVYKNPADGYTIYSTNSCI